MYEEQVALEIEPVCVSGGVGGWGGLQDRVSGNSVDSPSPGSCSKCILRS